MNPIFTIILCVAVGIFWGIVVPQQPLSMILSGVPILILMPLIRLATRK